MGLAVGSWQIADPEVQSWSLRPTVGGYELVFGLRVPIRTAENVDRRAFVAGTRVTVRPNEGEAQKLGFARPERPIEVASTSKRSPESHDLYLSLQPGQLAALETLRGKGDLSFEFEASGTGLDEHGEQYVLGNWRHRVPRSDWIAQLRAAGARNVLLLEVPIPLRDTVDGWRNMATSLQRAENSYRDGDYHGCIGSCRTVLEELWRYRYGDGQWASRALVPLASRATRDDMDQAAREAAVYAVLRHYTHQAHHGPSEGGIHAYTRAEAQFVLGLAAAAMAHAQTGSHD